MANQEKKGVGLLKYLYFAPEAREDGGVSEPVEGRFRYFLSTFRAHNSGLMLANLLLLVTFLPLIAIAILPSVYSVEKISYWLHHVVDLPYFMSSIGMGLSSAGDLLDARVAMLDVYAWGFLFAGISMLFASVGVSGMMHLCVKFIWKDSFVTKKDSYGNDVPKVIVEFFRGIKKFWWQNLIVGAIMMAIVAGVGNAYVFFLKQFRQGLAGAGEWVMIFAVSIVALFGVMFVLYMLPMIVMYDIPFAKKMRNAAILTVNMFVQNLFLVVAFAVPIVLIAVTGRIIRILIIAVVLVFGSSFYCLMLANYAQYYAEKIITPVYNARASKSKKKAKNKK